MGPESLERLSRLLRAWMGGHKDALLEGLRDPDLAERVRASEASVTRKREEA